MTISTLSPVVPVFDWTFLEEARRKLQCQATRRQPVLDSRPEPVFCLESAALCPTQSDYL